MDISGICTSRESVWKLTWRLRSLATCTYVADLSRGGTGMGITSEQSMRLLLSCPVIAILAMADAKFDIISAWLSVGLYNVTAPLVRAHKIIHTNHGLPFASSPIVSCKCKVGLETHFSRLRDRRGNFAGIVICSWKAYTQE